MYTIRKHHSPTYIFNRIKLFIVENIYKKNPWWTLKSISIIKKHLKKHHKVLEFGSGRSTLWLSGRTSTVTSIEHNKKWYNILKPKTLRGNIKLHLIEDLDKYSKFSLNFEDDFFDVLIIDGKMREEVFLNSYKKIKRGGLIIFDNANRHLVNFNSVSPDSIKNIQSKQAKKILNKIGNSKVIWTSNGVTDTLLIFKK